MQSFLTRLDTYYAKLRQVLGFINPVVDNDIFEPERNFSGVCNTFVNH